MNKSFKHPDKCIHKEWHWPEMLQESPWCPETCSHFVPAKSLQSLWHACIRRITARPLRGIGILLNKLLWIYRETPREWEKKLKKGTWTAHQKSSLGRGMLPNFSPSSGSSRTASASRAGGVWVVGEGGGMQEGSMRESSFFPSLRWFKIGWIIWLARLKSLLPCQDIPKLFLKSKGVFFFFFKEKRKGKKKSRF